jgi:D-3-phosphoglycerate dehydrogenase / 2-oxoglutarate reductase
MSLNVLLLENVHPVADTLLKEAGLHVKRINTALKEDDLIAAVAGVHLLGIRSKTNITKKVFESKEAKHLMGVGAFCIGTNQIALDAGVKRGVCVFNAPFSNTRSVAEMVMAEIIMLSRHLGDRNTEMHQGIWKKLATGSREVRGKTLGVIGYGHIGTQIGILAEFFGMKVIFYDVAAKLPLGNAQSESVLDGVLQKADFVTLHVPETPQTKNLMGAKQLQKMKKGASLINASRGTVVDLVALAELLKSGHLEGAALDVYPDEPESSDTTGFVSPVQGLKNVILTPHIGGSTLEAQENIGREVASSLIRYAQSGASTGSVNFPMCELGSTQHAVRLTHVHQNVPGVMRDVNRVIGDAGANILAQVLSTNAEVGYLIMDVEGQLSQQVVDGLDTLPATIHARACIENLAKT